MVSVLTPDGHKVSTDGVDRTQFEEFPLSGHRIEDQPRAMAFDRGYSFSLLITSRQSK